MFLQTFGSKFSPGHDALGSNGCVVLEMAGFSLKAKIALRCLYQQTHRMEKVRIASS